MLVVAAEGLGAVLHLPEHEQAEQALRENQLLFDALDVEVGQPRFDVGEAGIALHGLAQALGDMQRRHLFLADGELIGAVLEHHPRRLILQVVGEEVDPAVGLKHVTVGRDDARAGRPGARGRLGGALGGQGNSDHFRNLENEAVGTRRVVGHHGSSIGRA